MALDLIYSKERKTARGKREVKQEGKKVKGRGGEGKGKRAKERKWSPLMTIQEGR